jgi:hypothetical protein
MLGVGWDQYLRCFNRFKGRGLISIITKVLRNKAISDIQRKLSVFPLLRVIVIGMRLISNDLVTGRRDFF